MTRFIAPIASIIVAALAAFQPDIQALIASNPTLAAIFAAIGGIAASFAPSPRKPE